MLRIVKTENGLVRGIPAADPRITAFKGIPFAAPPVGENRWRAPQPAENWEGIRDCYTFAPIAMQGVPGSNPGDFYAKEFHVVQDMEISEDCLYLNVWTPAKTGEEKLPVMLWIYGGAFSGGYTSEMEFDGERIARRGVILVSVSYRVGVFGFLSHAAMWAENPEAAVGNFGLLDQMESLRWIKKNISAFGGDPDNVTIFGQSAGAGSVMSLVTSPYCQKEKLFHKAIMQSGGGLRKYGQGNGAIPLETALQNGKEFFEKYGITSLEEARAIPADQMHKMGSESGGLGKWAPTVDGIFLTEEPSDAMAMHHYPDIKMLFGCTGVEFSRMRKTLPETLEELNSFAEQNFGKRAEEFMELCKTQCMEKYGVVNDETIRMLCIAEPAFEGRFMNNILYLIRRLECGMDENYMYYFDPTIPGDDAGSYHSSELWFVFETLAKCWRPFGGKHYDLARIICNYWTNFAKNGNPNGPDHDGTQMPEWKSATIENPFVMFLGEEYLGEFEDCITPIGKFRIAYVLRDVLGDRIN